MNAEALRRILSLFSRREWAFYVLDDIPPPWPPVEKIELGIPYMVAPTSARLEWFRSEYPSKSERGVPGPSINIAQDSVGRMKVYPQPELKSISPQITGIDAGRHGFVFALFLKTEVKLVSPLFEMFLPYDLFMRIIEKDLVSFSDSVIAE